MFFVPTVGFSSGYVAQPAHFDGIVDYLTRGAGFSGAVDSGIFTLSFWINPSIDSTRQWIFAGAQALAGGSYRGIVVEKSATNGIRVYGYNAGVTSILQCNIPDSSVLAAGGWKHVLMSFDLSNVAKRFIYLNDVAQSVTYTTYTNGTLDFTLLDWSIAAMASGIEDYTGDIADLWFSPGLYLDLSVTANRRNFINANGKPVFLGINGQLPTGGAPLVFMSQTSSSNDWITNKGGGGGYTTHGTITRSQTSPSNGYTPPAYIAEPVFFDGTNDYLTRGATITGAADGKLVTFSFWAQSTVDSASNDQMIFVGLSTVAGAGMRFRLIKQSADDCFNIVGVDSAGAQNLQIRTPIDSFAAGSGWHHFCGCVDLADTNKRFIYMDDVAQTLTVSAYTNSNMDHTIADWAIGGRGDGTGKFTGDVADLWVALGTYIDLSVTANRRKFIDASGDPVELGEYGEIPTGTQPIVYLHGDPSTWYTNDGTGGGFTIHGVLISSLTSPSPGYDITDVASLYDLGSSLSQYPDSGGPQAGGALFINSQPLGAYDYTIKDGPVTISSFTESSYFSATADSKAAIVVIKGDLTINAGQIFKPANRKLFTTVYVTGNCAINGELSMTARGANHSVTGGNITAAAIRIATGTFSGVTNPQIPAAGGGGGGTVTDSTGNGLGVPGNSGTAGTSGGSGGGGGGCAYYGSQTGVGGSGAAGTSFSGGPGGGAGNETTGQNAFADGGAGGIGAENNSATASGGAGNPGGIGSGSGNQPGANGTGGTLVLMVGGTLSGTGTITSNGAAGGAPAIGGGGSGGGSITVMYGADTSSITPVAAGGLGGAPGGASYVGGTGGAGTARKLNLIIPGSQNFTASGNFTVPAFNNLTVTLWGAGGGGGAGGTGGGNDPGFAGGQTQFASPTPMIGNGGGGGGIFDGSNGVGGTASGGTTNTTGSNGSQASGGASPNGGATAGTGANGNIPGGGGGGGDDSQSSSRGRGGGGGGYSTKTFTSGQLTLGAIIAVTVGAGGAIAASSGGGVGARGQVNISWS